MDWVKVTVSILLILLSRGDCPFQGEINQEVCDTYSEVCFESAHQTDCADLCSACGYDASAIEQVLESMNSANELLDAAEVLPTRCEDPLMVAHAQTFCNTVGDVCVVLCTGNSAIGAEVYECVDDFWVAKKTPLICQEFTRMGFEQIQEEMNDINTFISTYDHLSEDPLAKTILQEKVSLVQSASSVATSSDDDDRRNLMIDIQSVLNHPHLTNHIGNFADRPCMNEAGGWLTQTATIEPCTCEWFGAGSTFMGGTAKCQWFCGGAPCATCLTQSFFREAWSNPAYRAAIPSWAVNCQMPITWWTTNFI